MKVNPKPYLDPFRVPYYDFFMYVLKKGRSFRSFGVKENPKPLGLTRRREPDCQKGLRLPFRLCFGA